MHYFRVLLGSFLTISRKNYHNWCYCQHDWRRLACHRPWYRVIFGLSQTAIHWFSHEYLVVENIGSRWNRNNLSEAQKAWIRWCQEMLEKLSQELQNSFTASLWQNLNIFVLNRKLRNNSLFSLLRWTESYKSCSFTKSWLISSVVLDMFQPFF